MIIDEFCLMAKFTEYNNLYFGGVLPYPQFGLLHGCQTVGYFSYLYDVPFGTSEKIEITDFYDYTEKQFRDVMVHEMIHYYLYYTGEDVKVKHGKAFKRKANEMNRAYGLNISQYVDISSMKPRKGAPLLSRLWFKIIN